MIDPDRLARIEGLVDDSGVCDRIEALLPIGVRPRQLRVRTLIIAILIALADHRPAHLTRVYEALVNLPIVDKWRLGVICDWHAVPHQLTYRQVEYTFGLVVNGLGKKVPDGEASATLAEVVGQLVQASIPATYKASSSSYAVDWTDVETFASAVSSAQLQAGHKGPADPEASWGHRNSQGRGGKNEMFFGYYLSLATMVADEGGGEVPEVVAAMNLTACRLDPVPAFLPTLARLHDSGVVLGDVLADAGYANRIPARWAIPLAMLGANIVTDLHPCDRGRQGTFAGAAIFNGNLYCPATPEALLTISPLSRQANQADIAVHDEATAELSRYKLPVIAADDEDGYHRRICPAAAGRVRCSCKPDSMALSFDRPEILAPPENPPTCCTQQTVTVPPTVAAKTRQKHDYPSKAHRISYARRTAVERSNSRIKDTATTDISRGWCRVMGVSAMSLLLACALVVSNLAVIDAFEARQVDNAARVAAGKPPRTRKRRRKTLADLAGANAPPEGEPARIVATA